MGNNRDHRKCAEECVAMARASDDAKDKALWITLAQSWVRLAEHVASSTADEDITVDAEGAVAVHAPD
jgi:hypothetical protein